MSIDFSLNRISLRLIEVASCKSYFIYILFILSYCIFHTAASYKYIKIAQLEMSLFNLTKFISRDLCNKTPIEEAISHAEMYTRELMAGGAVPGVLKTKSRHLKIWRIKQK